MRKSDEEYYKIVLSFTLGTILLSFVLHRHWIAWISFGGGFVALAAPALGHRLVAGLLFVQRWIGKILNIILLGSVFYLILTPLALLRRMMQRTSGTANDGSYFHTVDKTFTANDFRRPW